jgi:2-dehydropantoate 2-reductase
MKVLFYGAGVLGSLYAARLQEAGHAVSILARGQRLADLREHGIVLQDANTGQRTTTRVEVLEQLNPEDAFDLVVVLMRKNQVPAVLPPLAANRHTPNVLFMGNNAAGPDEMVQALGRERVLLGFGSAGGLREGHVVRYVDGSGRNKSPVTLGELDGHVTPRLRQVAGAFEQAGFPVRLSPNMAAWLKTHVALVSPIANALYMAGGDNHRLAHTRDGVVLMLRGIREGLRVLRALDVPILPPSLDVMARLPEPLLVALAQRALDTEFAEIALAGHANAARDEMTCLADEFRVLARSASLPTPAIDRLYTYTDPAVPPMAEGSAQVALDWRGVWAALSLLALVLTGLVLVWKMGRSK